MERPTFVFETTTAALWGEEVAQARGIPAELVPAPAESRAKCDLALVTLPDRGDELASALEEEKVPTRRWT